MEVGEGHQVFPSAKLGRLNQMLRKMMEALQIPAAKLYRTHDLRRGHADDLRRSGRLASLTLQFVPHAT
eukprot:12413235-Karenia_brevis.AAC.1